MWHYLLEWEVELGTFANYRSSADSSKGQSAFLDQLEDKAGRASVNLLSLQYLTLSKKTEEMIQAVKWDWREWLKVAKCTHTQTRTYIELVFAKFAWKFSSCKTHSIEGKGMNNLAWSIFWMYTTCSWDHIINKSYISVIQIIKQLCIEVLHKNTKHICINSKCKGRLLVNTIIHNGDM